MRWRTRLLPSSTPLWPLDVATKGAQRWWAAAVAGAPVVSVELRPQRPALDFTAHSGAQFAEYECQAHSATLLPAWYQRPATAAHGGGHRRLSRRHQGVCHSSTQLVASPPRHHTTSPHTTRKQSPHPPRTPRLSLLSPCRQPPTGRRSLPTPPRCPTTRR